MSGTPALSLSLVMLLRLGVCTFKKMYCVALVVSLVWVSICDPKKNVWSVHGFSVASSPNMLQYPPICRCQKSKGLSILKSSTEDIDDWYADFDPSAFDVGVNVFDTTSSNRDRYDGGGGGRGRPRANQGRFTGGSGRGGSAGYVRDTSADNSNIDVSAVESLINDRSLARKTGDFDRADDIRDQLLSDFGVQVWDRDRLWRSGCSDSGSGRQPPAPRNDRDRFGRGGRGDSFGRDSRGRSDRFGQDGRRRPPKDFGVKGHDYNMSPDAGPIAASLSENEIDALIGERLQCKLNRNFQDADRIQLELASHGVYVHDGMKEWRADGVMFGDYVNGVNAGRQKGSRNDRNQPYTQSMFSDPDNLSEDQIDEISTLVSRRAGAKMSRDFSTADGIRDQLREDFNVFIDDRLRQWSIGGDFGPDAPNNEESSRPWTQSLLSEAVIDGEQEADILMLLEKRTEAKKARDFEVADSIRLSLQEDFNVVINDRLREWSIGGDFGLPTKEKDADRPFIRRGGGDLTEEEVAQVSVLVGQRNEAKMNGDFESADAIRDELEARFSVKVDDRSREWRVQTDEYIMTAQNANASQVSDDLIDYVQLRLKERLECKKNKDFEAADDIRDELKEEYGVSIDDRTREWSLRLNEYSVVDEESNGIRSSPPPPPRFKTVDDNEVEIPQDLNADQQNLEICTDEVVSINDESENTQTDLMTLTVVQLKEKLREAGLPVSGKKAELIERLISFDEQ